MLGTPILTSGQDNRTGQRDQEFSAAVVFDFDDARIVNCLVRNSTDKGAQLRIGANSAIAPGAWLINLKRRMAFELFPVWRRPSLMGVKFAKAHAIDDTLPPHLDALKAVLADARQNHARRMVNTGICSRDQQEMLAVSYSSWGMVDLTPV